MRVGLDARITRRWSVGMRIYARELLERLPKVAPDIEFAVFAEGANFGWDEQVGLPGRLRGQRLDLAHFLSLYVPAFPPRPYVVTIHDLIHLRYPQYFKKSVGPYYRTIVRFACSRAACVITDDERTVEDLQRFLGVAPARVKVIALGVEDLFLAPVQPHRAPRPYVMYSGNHRPHKDLPTLFAAWAGLPETLDVDLYVTGPDDFGGSLARYARPNRRIVPLGDVHGERLAGYYAGARALAHPALCEGFGLPLLEAMAARTPVVACDGALPRVLGPAALVFPSGDVAALRAQLERVLTNEGLRTALVNEGRTLAERLTWDRCARETAAVYREILEIPLGEVR